MNERRRARRAIPAHEIVAKVGGNHPAKVIDITPNGARLELASALAPRGRCRLSLPLPEGIVRLRAQVVHCKLTGTSPSGSDSRLIYRAGVKFSEIDGKLAAAISRAFPLAVAGPTVRTPIKVKVRVETIGHVPGDFKHRPN